MLIFILNIARGYLIKANSYQPNQPIFLDELAQSAAGLAMMSYELKDYEGTKRFSEMAIKESDSALVISPYNTNLLRSKASLLIRLSAFDEKYLKDAASSIENLISLAPTDAKLYYNLGLVYARLGDTNKAFEYFLKAVELKENYRDARFALALMYSSQNDKDKAREEIEYILKYINPNDELVKNKLQEI